MTHAPRRVPDDALEMDDAQFVLLDGEYFTGTAFEALPDGRVIGETEYVRGLRDGIERVWHRNGQLRSETAYEKGVSHGLRREWHENGQLALERRYEHGKVVGEQYWDERGAPLPPPRAVNA